MQTTDQETLTDEERWSAVLRRDRNADGLFYYAVSTTGVYCSPSCPSRRADRRNVRFFLRREEAENAGFRPCKRCKPHEASLRARQRQMVARACKLLSESGDVPSLNELAEKIGMSPYHFHRIFKLHTGLTPKAFALAQREERVRQTLKESGTVTQAMFDADYSTSSRFYENASSLLGMTPSQFKAGGLGTRIRFAVGECSLGSVLVAQSERGICAVSLGDSPDMLVHELQDRFPQAEIVANDAGFDSLVATVVGFIDAPAIGFDLPLDIQGTAFQKRVWQALREIPVGVTISYTELARRLGQPKSVRAVASACAANTLAVVIPCHRVVRTDGSLSGYRWGIERKRSLIDSEDHEES